MVAAKHHSKRDDVPSEGGESSSEEDAAQQVDEDDLPPRTFCEYRRGRELGRGGSARVFVCRRKDCAIGFAVKAVDLRRVQLSPNSELEKKTLYRELEILKALPSHPHIVQMVDAFENAHWFLLVLELVGGGDLFTCLTSRSPARLLEPEVLHVLRQLASGLDFLHGQKIIHRDLKLENTLVAAERREKTIVLYTVKITDFGLSKVVCNDGSAAMSLVGTQQYVAPEVSLGNTYGFSSDFWCLGVLLYVLLVGRFPFDNTPSRQLDVDHLLENMKVSRNARSAIAGLLRILPSERLSLDKLLVHEWLLDASGGGIGKTEKAAKRLRVFSGNDSLNGVLPLPLQIKTAEVEIAPPRTPSEPTPSETSIAKCNPEAAPEVIVGKKVEQPSPQLAGASRDWLARIFNASRPQGEMPFASSDVLELDEVRPLSVSHDLMQVYVMIPNQHVDTVLGRSGVEMKRTAASVGCKVRFGFTKESDHHIVLLVGKYRQCILLQELFHGRVADAARNAGEEPQLDVEAVLLVRLEAAGIVLGKQGFVLNQIGKKWKVKLQLLPEHVNSQRPCVLRGAFRNILRAEKHIFQLTRTVCAVDAVPESLELPWSPPPASPAMTPFIGTPFPSPLPSP